jgi:hypothetical protein
MTKTRVFDPTIDSFLEGFFGSLTGDMDLETRQRTAEIRKDLMEHMDAEGWRVLNPPQTVLLEAEREFRPDGAFARTAHVSDLFCILEHYLDPVHAQLGIEQRQAQLDVVKAIAETLWTGRYISFRTVSTRCRVEFDVAMKRGRELVDQARARERAMRH